MDEGIIMDELQGAGKRKKDFPASPETISRRKEKKRPEPFPPGENGVPHGLMENGIVL
jgi:hypothetical protein